MRREIIDILACPLCKGDLILTVVEENDNGITKGTFKCEKCNINYPIEEGIPNMLPLDMR